MTCTIQSIRESVEIREAVERMSERADTAYSPRVREEEHSAAASRILLQLFSWLGFGQGNLFALLIDKALKTL